MTALTMLVSPLSAGPSLVVVVAGEADWGTASQLRDQLTAALAYGPQSLVLDLTDLNAANLGVSKRHAMIRRSGSGFEVLDLSSRNGTWLNAERLVPNRPYPFASGSQIRIGQMRLLVVYHSEPKDTQKS